MNQQKYSKLLYIPFVKGEYTQSCSNNQEGTADYNTGYDIIFENIE